MTHSLETANKATLKRFHEAMSSGDWDFMSKTIDELVEPDAQIRTPLPIDVKDHENSPLVITEIPHL